MLRFDAAVVSDTGTHRASNQDSAFASPIAAGVADGVGGGPAGDVASALLVHRLAAGGFHVGDEPHVRQRMHAANGDLGAMVRRDAALEGMATTFTAIFLSGDDVLIAHVGDSRGYLLRDGVLSRQTRDDSYVQLLVDAGLVRAEDAFSHPRRHIVTATFRGGDDDASRMGVVSAKGRDGDRWLLCSDGVSDYLPEDLLQGLLPTGSSAQAARAIVEQALDAGSLDNVTAVVVDVVAQSSATTLVAASPVFAGAAAARYCEDIA